METSQASKTADKFKDWPWQYVASFERVHASNVVEMVVNLGFNHRIHAKFILSGIDPYSLSSMDETERRIALGCTSFISNELSSAHDIIVESSKKGDSGDYYGNIMYNKPSNVNMWFSLSNEMIVRSILPTKVDIRNGR